MEIENSLFYISLFFILTSFFFVKGMYQKDDVFLQINYVLLIFSTILLITYRWEIKSIIPSIANHRLALIIALNVSIRMFVLLGSPNPIIDVFHSLKEAPKAIIQGINPYDYSYSKVYRDIEPFTYFPYPPAALYLVTTSVILTNDPRFLFIVSETATAYLLYKILKRKKVSQNISELVAFSYLFFPATFFVLEQSWLDPAVTFLLVFFAYLANYYPKKQFLAAIALGLAMGVKQYLIILPIFFLRNIAKYKKILIFAAAVFVLTTLPFVLADPSKFNVYRLEYRYSSFYNSLTLASFLFKNFNVSTPIQTSYIAWIVLTLLTITKRPKEIWKNYFIISWWLLGLFYFGNVGFLNEYYLSYTMLVASFVLSIEVVKNNS